MFKLHDIIVASPENTGSGASDVPTRAKVIYIHPEGRFYVLEFQYLLGKVHETRYFTEGELEAARREGILGKRAEHPTGTSDSSANYFDEEFAAMMSEFC